MRQDSTDKPKPFQCVKLTLLGIAPLGSQARLDRFKHPREGGFADRFAPATDAAKSSSFCPIGEVVPDWLTDVPESREAGDRMRIVYVSYLHPAIVPGGVQQLAYDLFEASERQGHLAYFIAAPEENHRAAYGKTNTPIVPVAGAERQCLYFPQGYDNLNLSNGDKRSIRFFRELIKRLRPDIVHFHHLHRIGVELIRAARLAAPDAILSLTFHDMAAICMADGAMLKQPSRVLCEAASPHACSECFPNLQPEFVASRATRLKAALGDYDLFVFPSEFIAYRYVDWGLPADKCVVVPNGQKNLAAGRDEGATREHSPHVN